MQLRRVGGTARTSGTRRRHDDSGFSLIEIGVASGVLFSVVLMLAYSGVIALVDVGHSRQRQGATGLANQALEQVRALPFATVALGLVTSDIETMADPNITRTGTAAAPNYTYRGETLAHGNHTSLAPLNPHRRSVTVEQTRYTVAVYVTRYLNNVNNNTLRVTAEVSWADPLRKGVVPKVEAQTIIYPGSGCQSTATHPYAAPCVGFFDASSTSAAGAIQFSGWVLAADGSQTNLVAELVLGTQRSTLKQEQVVTLQQTAATAGVALTEQGIESRYQGESIKTGADTDPTSGSDEDEAQSEGPIGPHLFGSGDADDNKIVVSNLGGDTLEASSTAAARSGATCRRDAPSASTFEDDGKPCGMAIATQAAGGDIALTINHPLAASTVVPLASIGRNIAAPSLPALTHFGLVDRSHAASGDCAGDGCATATARSRVGTFLLGSDTAPLVQLIEGTATATAASGQGAAPPTTTRAGTLVWAGASGDESADIDVPRVVSATRTYSVGELTVNMAGTFTVDPPRFEADACTTTCTRTNSVASIALLSGVGTYDVFAGSVHVARFEFSINLGGLTARSLYKAPPSSA